MIIAWKSNRAKGKTRDKLKGIAGGNFEAAAKKIASSLLGLPSSEGRLKFLMKDCGLRLPTATAILTIFYPTDFTVYDSRVRLQLGLDPIKENYSSKGWDAIWNAYRQFMERVVAAAPADYSLRDKDRYLWGKSYFEDAEKGWRK
jgi:hypothetical protein